MFQWINMKFSCQICLNASRLVEIKHYNLIRHLNPGDTAFSWAFCFNIAPRMHCKWIGCIHKHVVEAQKSFKNHSLASIMTMLLLSAIIIYIFTYFFVSYLYSVSCCCTATPASLSNSLFPSFHFSTCLSEPDFSEPQLLGGRFSLSHFNSLFSLTWVFWALQRGWMGEALVALNSPRLYDYSFLLPASSRRDRRPAEHRGSCSIAANCDEFSTDVFLLVPLQPVSSAFSTTGPPFVFSVLLPSSLPHFFSLIFSEHSWGIVSVMEGSVLVGCASQYVYVGMSVSVCLYDKWNVRRCSTSFWKNDGCQNTLTWKK